MRARVTGPERETRQRERLELEVAVFVERRAPQLDVRQRERRDGPRRGVEHRRRDVDALPCRQLLERARLVVFAHGHDLGIEAEGYSARRRGVHVLDDVRIFCRHVVVLAREDAHLARGRAMDRRALAVVLALDGDGRVLASFLVFQEARMLLSYRKVL